MSNQVYDVESEFVFLDGMGRWSNAAHKFTRAQLFEGYLRGLAKRYHTFNDAQKDVLRERVAILMRQA